MPATHLHTHTPSNVDDSSTQRAHTSTHTPQHSDIFYLFLFFLSLLPFLLSQSTKWTIDKTRTEERTMTTTTSYLNHQPLFLSITFVIFSLLLYWLSLSFGHFHHLFCFCSHLSYYVFFSYPIISFVYLLSKFVYFVHQACSNTGRPQLQLKLKLSCCYCCRNSSDQEWPNDCDQTRWSAQQQHNLRNVKCNTRKWLSKLLGCCFAKRCYHFFFYNTYH